MHSCNIKYLYKGTKELEKFYENETLNYKIAQIHTSSIESDYIFY